MATTIDNFVVKISTTGAEGLKAVATGARAAGDSIETLNSKLGGMKSVIAGLGLATFAAQALQLADGIGDVADASGYSIERITALSAALEGAGGKFDDAGKLVAKFQQNLTEALEGGEKQQKAFTEVLAKTGTTLAQAGRLTEEQFFNKTIEGLAKMEAGAQRTALGVEIFGKAFRTIDPAKLQELLTSGDFTKLQEEIRKGTEITETWEKTVLSFKFAMLTTLNDIADLVQPLLEYFKKFGVNIEDMNGKVIAIKVAFGALAAAIGLSFGATAVGAIKNTVEVLRKVLALTRGIAVATIAAAAANPVTAALAVAAAAAGTAAYLLINKASAESADAQISDAQRVEDAKRAISDGNTPASGGKVGGGKVGGKPLGGFKATPAQEAAAAALKAAQAETSQLEKNLRISHDLAVFKAGLIELSRTDADVAERLVQHREAEAAAAEKIAEIDKKISTERSKKDANAGVIVELEKQKDLITNQLGKTKELVDEEAKRVAANRAIALAQQTQADAAQKALQIQSQVASQNIQRQVISGAIGPKQAQALQTLRDLQASYEGELLSLQTQRAAASTEIERKAIDDRIGTLKGFYDQRVALAKQGFELEKELQQSSIAGFKSALESINAGVTPFKVMEDSTRSVFSNMTSAIDKFVETGKFKFKDFAGSVIKDLLKIQLRAQATSLLSSLLGSFLPGAGSTGAGLDRNAYAGFGADIGIRANGGPVTGGSPYIVGEVGPELVIPSASGSVVSNKDIASALGGSGGGQTTVNNYYNIQGYTNEEMVHQIRSTIASSARFIYGVSKVGETEAGAASYR